MQQINLTHYLVLDPGLCAPLGMVETARQAAHAGMTVVQLRAPDWKKRAYAECARALLSVLHPLGVSLIINDHVDVALAVGADGVHVGQSDLSPEDCRKLLGPLPFLGLSVSSLAEAQSTPTQLVDYIGIGPIWTTSTKPDAAPAMGIEGLKAVLSNIHLPHVAIGGIGVAQLPSLIAAGASGYAVVSAVCGQPDVSEAAHRLISTWQSHNGVEQYVQR